MTNETAIGFTSLKMPAEGTLVVLAGDKRRFGPAIAELDQQTGGQVMRAVEVMKFEGGEKESIDLISPAGTRLARLVVIGLGAFKDPAQKDFVALGGRIGASLKGNKSDSVTIYAEGIGKEISFAPADIAAMALGLQLRRYKFRKYKTVKKDKEENGAQQKISFACADADAAGKVSEQLDALRRGVVLARDLVNEPANHLGPVEFALRAKELEGLGVTVTVLDEMQMAEKGMNALLGVGQGSARGSRLVVMEWHGSSDRNDKPVAVVGKGVCFDTGGISIKPAQGMEDMKGDMGGAACVTGLMRTLAERKAKANVAGIIGLVENMPDGKAQRPGDIVTSMSGQTIEVLNTDAEGRLVLADALWYAKEQFKPKVMIDLATLTGAIIVALGKEYAGLFSNNDRLAKKLIQAGDATGEKLWRMPLAPEYDKLIDCDNADMKNIGGRDAGSITAAQFLQRFVGDVHWAHLDIAGTAMGSPKRDTNESWGSGFGVMLLNEFIARNHE
jgi:leucyl aminopeptidase